MENQMVRHPTRKQATKPQEKRKKNGRYMSKSARGLGIFCHGAGPLGAMGFAMSFSLTLGCSSVPTTFHPREAIAPSQWSYHSFNQVLERAVHAGQVDYSVVDADSRFTEYTRQLDHIDPTGLSTREEQIAFWINAYNAFAIQGILDGESPVPYVGWYRYFKLRRYAVGGATVSLYDLEHEILRRQFNEPRVHFAIVCASRSCPKLQAWAYEGHQLERQLDRATREFIADSTRNRFDRQGKVAYLSKIFDWFKEDFVGNTGSVPAFIARYVEDPGLAHDLAVGLYRIEYVKYDWSLNGLAPPR